MVFAPLVLPLRIRTNHLKSNGNYAMCSNEIECIFLFWMCLNEIECIFLISIFLTCIDWPAFAKKCEKLLGMPNNFSQVFALFHTFSASFHTIPTDQFSHFFALFRTFSVSGDRPLRKRKISSRLKYLLSIETWIYMNLRFIEIFTNVSFEIKYTKGHKLGLI